MDKIRFVLVFLLAVALVYVTILLERQFAAMAACP
jgi:hypothetical protein